MCDLSSHHPIPFATSPSRHHTCRMRQRTDYPGPSQGIRGVYIHDTTNPSFFHFPAGSTLSCCRLFLDTANYIQYAIIIHLTRHSGQRYPNYHYRHSKPSLFSRKSLKTHSTKSRSEGLEMLSTPQEPIQSRLALGNAFTETLSERQDPLPLTKPFVSSLMPSHGRNNVLKYTSMRIPT